MSFSIGIIGLPNAGKSTLFKALTEKEVDIASYPFTTINPNAGIVFVSDKRLKKLAALLKPEKITKTAVEFIDIAGLVKNAHKGEGLGNQFLSHIRNCDAAVEVVRVFEDSDVKHIENKTEPLKDIEIMEKELLMKDLETAEKAIFSLAKIKEEKELKKLIILKKIKEFLVQNKPLRKSCFSEEEKKAIKEYRFLTEKPLIYFFNIKEPKEDLKEKLKKTSSFSPFLFFDAKLEKEFSELSKKERKELNFESRLDQLISACYNSLDLITFFTITGGKEIRAWTLKKGQKAIEAAEKVHSDFKEKFVKAETVLWNEIIEAGSWSKAKESGKIKTAGKDYTVQDGDVIEFRI